MNIEEIDYINKEIENIENIDCFGITFDDGVVNEVKCYRIDTLKKEFCNAINKNSLRKYYRINVSEIDKFDKILEDFIYEHNYLGSKKEIMKLFDITQKYGVNRFRPMQIGFNEIDGSKMSLKVYFSLRKFNSILDYKGKQQAFDDIEDILNEIRCLLNLDMFNNIQSVVEKSTERGYYPSLLGINQNENNFEIKLYFELFNPNTYFHNIKNHSFDVVESICNYKNGVMDGFVEFNNIFIKKSFFMRGLAISSNSNLCIKMYFAPMYKFL